jgi:hypothetical protein
LLDHDVFWIMFSGEQFVGKTFYHFVLSRHFLIGCRRSLP